MRNVQNRERNGLGKDEMAGKRIFSPVVSGTIGKVLGVVVFLGGAILALTGRFMADQGAANSKFIVYLVQVVGWVCVFGGIGIFNQSRKAVAPGARQVFAQDKRKPVLYLRSFKDDPVTSKEKGVVDWETFEEEIANVMRQIGPFIAVGNPRDELPALGAARAYLADNEWQRTVSILASHAQLVVLRAGDTPGLMWEVEMVSKKVKPEQLLLLIPCNKQQYDGFSQKAGRFFPKSLPEYAGPTHEITKFFSWDEGARIKGIVYFEKDWTPHFARVKPSLWKNADIRTATTSALVSSLQPVFKQLNISHAHAVPPFLVRLTRILLLSGLVFLVTLIACYISYKLSIP